MLLFLILVLAIAFCSPRPFGWYYPRPMFWRPRPMIRPMYMRRPRPMGPRPMHMRGGRRGF